MTRGALVGLVAIAAMFILPPLLAWHEAWYERVTRRIYRPPTHPRPEHPDHDRRPIQGQILRPGREMDRWRP